MRLALTIAALALGTTSTLAQMGPGGQFRVPDDTDRIERQDRAPRDWDRGGRDLRDDGDDRRFERAQRRDRDVTEDRDIRRGDRNGREWGRQDRDRDEDRRGGYRGPVISFGAPGYFVRTLPARTREVRFEGQPCRTTITRRVNYRGDILETERRRCPGRSEVVMERR